MSPPRLPAKSPDAKLVARIHRFLSIGFCLKRWTAKECTSSSSRHLCDVRCVVGGDGKNSSRTGSAAWRCPFKTPSLCGRRALLRQDGLNEAAGAADAARGLTEGGK